MTKILNLDIAYYQNRIEKLLDTQLPDSNYILHQAMRYSVLNDGKRLRPLLVYGAGAIINAPIEKLDNVAIAVECIHAYSLIHDDLPAMDNDDFRRGKPSCHKQFDEATAILAGDALQSFAMEMLGRNADCSQIILLSQAIGVHGMALGQSEDMKSKHKKPDQKKQYQIHQLKTGKLITASIQLGLFCGEYTDDDYNILTKYAENFGLAFQLRDDLLDKEFYYYTEEDLTKEVNIYFNQSEEILNSIKNSKIYLLRELINSMRNSV